MKNLSENSIFKFLFNDRHVRGNLILIKLIFPPIISFVILRSSFNINFRSIILKLYEMVLFLETNYFRC